MMTGGQGPSRNMAGSTSAVRAPLSSGVPSGASAAAGNGQVAAPELGDLSPASGRLMAGNASGWEGRGEGRERMREREGNMGLGILGAALVIPVVVAPFSKTLALVLMALLTLYLAVASDWVAAWLTMLSQQSTCKPRALSKQSSGPLTLEPPPPSTPRAAPATSPLPCSGPPPPRTPTNRAPTLQPPPPPVPPMPEVSDLRTSLQDSDSAIDPMRRDFSLHGARVDMAHFRVVDNEYATHRVDVACKGMAWSIWKRYSDFEDLRECLAHALTTHRSSQSISAPAMGPPPVPALPPKTIFRTLTHKFLTQRTEQLCGFLREVLKRRDLCDEPILRAFLDASPLAPLLYASLDSSEHSDTTEPVPIQGLTPPVSDLNTLPILGDSASETSATQTPVIAQPDSEAPPAPAQPPSSFPSPFPPPTDQDDPSPSSSKPSLPSPPPSPVHDNTLPPVIHATLVPLPPSSSSSPPRPLTPPPSDPPAPPSLSPSPPRPPNPITTSPSPPLPAPIDVDSRPTTPAPEATGRGLMRSLSRLFTATPPPSSPHPTAPSDPPEATDTDTDTPHAAIQDETLPPPPPPVMPSTPPRGPSPALEPSADPSSSTQSVDAAEGSGDTTTGTEEGGAPSSDPVGEPRDTNNNNDGDRGDEGGDRAEEGAEEGGEEEEEGGGDGGEGPPDRSLSGLTASYLEGGRGAYYDPGPTNSFHVRGKTYMHDSKKIPAGPAVGQLVFGGVFRTAEGSIREDHICSRGRVAQVISELSSTSERPFLFVLNLQVPGDPPLSLVFIFALPFLREDGLNLLPEPPVSNSDTCLRPFFRTLRRFVDFSDLPSSSTDSVGSGHAHWTPAGTGAGASSCGSETGSRSAASSVTSDEGSHAPDDEDEEGIFPLTDFKNKRFKLIPTIVDGPSVVRWAVGSKPAILGQKLTQRYHRGPQYVETDIDVASSVVASQIVSLCRGYARHLTVELGVVLQGECEDELPEKLIGCIGINKLNLTQDWAQNQR